ncbi:MAG: radical SAM protein [Anaerolineae bacterium]
MSLPNYLLNLLTLARGRNTLRPLVGIFHLTGRCNLNCAYCEDYGARRPDDSLAALGVLPLPQAQRVLAVLRQAAPHLILTGGEPLLYPDIDALAASAKRELRFKSVTLLTNGLRLPKHPGLLPLLNRLVISLDSLDAARWGETLGVGSRAAQSIIDTVDATAAEQQRHGFRLVVNCVVTPQTLPDALAVLDFCAGRDIAFAFSPQSFNNWPHYDLLVSRDYPAFVDEVIARKQRGARILGSLPYLRKMRGFEPFNCYPTLAPRVLPNGELIYPCRPIERGHTPHGGRPCNLTEVASWAEARAAAEAQYGAPPKSCVSCFQQCYAEPSLMQAQPLALAGELVRFSASRRLGLTTFAPG